MRTGKEKTATAKRWVLGLGWCWFWGSVIDCFSLSSLLRINLCLVSINLHQPYTKQSEENLGFCLIKMSFSVVKSSE